MQLAFDLPVAPPSERLFSSEAVRAHFFELLARGALVALSHSGGKDSQAALVSRIVPVSQLLVVHAPLRDVEWPGTLAHVRATLPIGVPLLLAHTAHGKTLLDRVLERGRWPDPARRWCTADFKRTPIERELRRYLRAHPEHHNLLLSAMGMRAQESPARARRDPWSLNPRNSKAGRSWYGWLPLHAITQDEVFEVIREAGQRPHWAYREGMSRLSCTLCIYSSDADLCNGARLRPRLYARYVHTERVTGHTLSPSRRTLPEITGIAA